MQDSVSKLSTYVIYVARSPALGLALGAGGIGQIIDGPEVRAEGAAVIITSMPNQFQAIITPSRLHFFDKSDQVPVRTDFPARLVKLAELIASQNNLSYSAVGLNFDVSYLAFGRERPSELILNRFVKEEAFAPTGFRLIGAAVRLWYLARDMRHVIYFEPRDNAYDGVSYQSHLNVHRDLDDSHPSQEWMTEAITMEYGDFLRVIQETLAVKQGGGST